MCSKRPRNKICMRILPIICLATISILALLADKSIVETEGIQDNKPSDLPSQVEALESAVDQPERNNITYSAISIPFNSSQEPLDVAKDGLLYCTMGSSIWETPEDCLLDKEKFPELYDYYTLYDTTYGSMKELYGPESHLQLEVFPCDLNGDGLMDYIVRFITGSGTRASSMYVHVQRFGGGYEVYDDYNNDNAGVMQLGVLPTITNGLHDLAFADSHFNLVYQFDGQGYTASYWRLSAGYTPMDLEQIQYQIKNNYLFIELPQIAVINQSPVSTSFYYYAAIQDASDNTRFFWASNKEGMPLLYTIPANTQADITFSFAHEQSMLNVDWEEKVDLQLKIVHSPWDDGFYPVFVNQA